MGAGGEAAWRRARTRNGRTGCRRRPSSPVSPTTSPDLEPDADGLMWVATAGRGFLVMQDGCVSMAAAADRPAGPARTATGPGPRGNFVWHIDVAERRAVWIGQGSGREDALGVGVLDYNGTFDTTLGRLLAVLRRRQWPGRESRGRDGTSGRHRHAAGGAGHHGRLRRRRFGPANLEPRTKVWRSFRTADAGLPSNASPAIAHDPASGATWFGTARRGVARSMANSWRWWRSFGRGRQVAKATEDAAVDLGRVAVDLPDQAASMPPPRPAALRAHRRRRDAVPPDAFDPHHRRRQALPGCQPTAGAGGAQGRRDLSTWTAGRPATRCGPSPSVPAARLWWAASRSTWLGNNCPTDWGTNCWLDGGLARYDGQRWRLRRAREGQERQDDP